MSTDKSVQNQKVFVKLQAVLQIQNRYNRTVSGERVCRTAESGSTEASRAAWQARKEAFEEIIAVLELPIEREG